MTMSLSRPPRWGLLCFLGFATLVGGVAFAEGRDDSFLAKKIEFDNKDGDEAFRLDPEGSEVELQTAGGKKRLASYQKKDATILIELPKRGVTGSVEVDADREIFTLKNETGVVQWTLEREPDGDWRLCDAKKTLKVKLKLRDDGYKLVDAEDNEKGRIKVKEDKISIRNGEKKEVLRTKDTRSPLVAACFNLEGLTMPQKGALALAVLSWPPKTSE